MRRSAWIFLAAILLPSLVLAWLAVRSARDQQVILEHQQAIICQDITDTLAKKVQDQVDGARQAFIQTTDQFLQNGRSPFVLAQSFNRQLRSAWDLAEVGFAVDLRGAIFSPDPQDSLIARTFRNENDRFLSNRENVEVFAQSSQAPSKMPQKMMELNQLGQAADLPSQTAIQETSPPDTQAEKYRSPNQVASDRNGQPNQSVNQAVVPQQQTTTQQERGTENRSSNATSRAQPQNQAAQIQQGNQAQGTLQSNRNASAGEMKSVQSANQMAQQQAMARKDSEVDQNDSAKPPPKKAKSDVSKQRLVEPQSNFSQSAVSNTVAEESDFRRVIASETSGALARFLEDKLRLMVWYRPTRGSLVFGAQILQKGLVDNIQPLLQSAELKKGNSPGVANGDYILAVLDDRGKPVALSREGARLDYKHPFAATEIGEALPHWEAALYLADPKQITRSASTLQLALGLIVAVLMAAILLGGWLMAADIRRQIRLAQQKTDFVSNVSHELKTPLTSIRMFADMLSEGRVNDHERQSNYLRIISAESARLTRLINNVLDFARMERGAQVGERRPCDLVEVVREVVDTCRPHLEAVGVKLAQEIQAEELPVMGDRDALAQIILNLLSNAEKYGGNEVLIRTRYENGEQPAGYVDVLDRGPGIPPKKQEAIFKPFERLNDSLASGVSGSGLGLTLARRMARAHGGDVTYSPREGGGSCFTLRVPLSAPATGAASEAPGKQVT